MNSNTMKIVDVEQGSDEWLEIRLKYACASEAPAVMGDSPYMTRNELLDLKKGWAAGQNSAFKERLFKSGHDMEDAQRQLLEVEHLDDLPGVCGYREVDGVSFWSSFDFFGEALKGEHKMWNQTLADNTRNGVFEPKHFWQLEHQCLTADLDSIEFYVSDGTGVNRVSATYFSLPERRKQLIDGWRQFYIDFDSHELKAKKEVAVANSQTVIDVIEAEKKGDLVVHNLASVLPAVMALAQKEIGKKLKTDQDFVDKQELNKEVKKSRARLSDLVDRVTTGFKSLDDFRTMAADLDKVLQNIQADGEKAVDLEKQRRKDEMVSDTETDYFDYLDSIDEYDIPAYSDYHKPIKDDLTAAIKGKRNTESLQAALDQTLADFKIVAKNLSEKIRTNWLFYQEHNSKFHIIGGMVDSLTDDPDTFAYKLTGKLREFEEAEEARKKEEADRLSARASVLAAAANKTDADQVAETQKPSNNAGSSQSSTAAKLPETGSRSQGKSLTAAYVDESNVGFTLTLKFGDSTKSIMLPKSDVERVSSQLVAFAEQIK